MFDLGVLEGGGDVGASVGGGNGESHQHARDGLIADEDDGVVGGVSESRREFPSPLGAVTAFGCCRR